MTSQTLLIELLTEELPPKNLLALSKSFTDSIVAGLVSAGLCAVDAEVKSYATPRRLGLKVRDVLATQIDRVVEKKGPSVASAYDADGKPTKALIGFATGAGVDVNSLEKVMDGKREVVMARVQQKGQTLAELLPAMLDQAIKALPVAKSMRWADLNESFVRPVHRITLLFGHYVLHYSRFGITSDRLTQGHRFLGKKDISIPHADDYESLMAGEGAVIADFSERREKILMLLDRAVKNGNGSDRWQASPALVDEVTALTENPTVIEGSFETHFLQVPQEALIVSMTQHQKYFPVVNADGKITSRFLLVANMPPAESSPHTIRHGNERVLRARLSDAQFFYDTDRKVTLANRGKGLAQVTHLQALTGKDGLGASLADRVRRITLIAENIAPLLGVDVNAVRRAAALCKNDLLTGLVGEFPELQGIAGEYYARHDGESADVALAIREHYAPRFSGDVLPSSPIGQVLALADKCEGIASMFGINRAPTGDKDPFALRRAALGMIRMMVELALPLDIALIFANLPKVFAHTAWQERHEGGETIALMLGFMQDRLRQYLRDQGHEISLVDAVLAHSPSRFENVLARLSALALFVKTPQAPTLIAMGKRIRNILKQQSDVVKNLSSLNKELLPESMASEKNLFQAVMALQLHINEVRSKQDFSGILNACAPLAEALAKFFDEVMVMDENINLCHQRLALLKLLDQQLNVVGDLGEIRLN